MKYLRAHSRTISHVMIALMTSWQVARPLQAATVYLDTNAATAGSGITNGATVAWDSSALWTTASDGTGTPAPWTAGDIAVFSAGTDATGSYTVAVGGTQTIGGLVFRSGNVSLTGGTLTLASASTFDVSTGLSAGVSSLLSGTFGLTKTGAGTLSLSGANSGFSGPVLLNRGTLAAQAGAQALGTGTLTFAGGSLVLANDTSLAFGNNTTVTGSAGITVDRLTSGAAVTHTLGTLSIGPQRLSIQAGTHMTSGTAGLVFGATTLTASGAIFDVGTGANLTLGAIGGNFNLFKTGAGTLTLGGTSTRAASTTFVTGGSVVQTNVAGLGTTAAILNLSGGATLDLATDASTTAYPTTLIGNATVLSNLATPGAGITHTLGTLTSVGANTLTIGKGANVSSGTAAVVFGNAITTGATTFQVGSGAQFTLGGTVNNVGFTTTFSGAGNSTVTGVLSGGGGVTMNGAGLLTLTAANTYGGITTINSGTVQLGNVTSLGAAATAATVMTGSSTLNTNGLAVALMNLSGTSGAVLQNGHAATASTLSLTTGANATSSFAGTIQNGGAGTLGITLNGTGALTLSGNNSYTGATTLTAGRLNINSSTALGGSASVFTLTTGIIDNTSGGAVVLTNNNAVTLGGNFTFGGTQDLSLGSTSTLTTTAGRTVTLMGGTGSTLTIGKWVNNVTAAATTTVRALPGSSSTLSIGTFDPQASGTAAAAVLAGNGNIKITNGIVSTLATAAMNFSTTGTVTLTGTSIYTGSTTFSAGNVVLDATAGTATLAASAPTFAGGTFTLKGNNAGTGLTLGNLSGGAGGSTLKVIGGTAGTTLTFGTTTVTTNNSTLNIILDSTSGAAAATTTSTTATNGILGAANARAAVVVTIGNSTELATLSGSGTNRSFLQYTGQTAFTGTTTGTATNYSVTGSQTLTTAASTPNSVKIITTGSGQSLDLGANTMQITSGGLLFVGANDYEIKGSAANALRSASATNSDLIVHNYGAGELNISAAIANGTGTSVVTVSGPGVTRLSGTNTYTGATYVTGGGTLSIAANSALGAEATGAALTLNSGTLRTTSTFALDNAGANIRAITLGAGGGIFDVAGGTTLSVLGVISSSGSLTKAGAGTLFLGAANTYSGGFTTIQAGALQLGGAAGAIASTNLVVLGSSTTNTSGKLVLGDASNTKTQVIAGLLTQGTGTANAVVGGNSANSTLTYTGTVAIPTTFTGTLGGAGINENNLALSITAGQLTLSGNNTYAGGTTLSGGILDIDSATAIGSGALTITGGSIDNTSGSPITLASNNAVALNGNIVYGASSSLNFGTGSVVTIGAGRTVTLLGGTASTSALSFGTWNVTAPALTLTVSALQGSGTTLNVGTLDLNNGATGTATIITGNGNVSITNKITATTAGQAFTYNGTGVLTLSGSASDYGGLTTIGGAGTVRLGAGGSLPSASGLTMTSGTFDLNGQNQTVATLTLTSPATISNTSATASTFTATNVATSTGNLSGNLSASLTLIGAAATLSGTYTNTGSLTFTNAGTGAITVSGSVLNGGNVTFNASNTQALTVTASYINPTGLILNSGSGTGATTISGNIGSNVTGVTQNSATSQLTLSGVNTYTGPTTVTAGTLVLPRTSALYNNNPASWTAANIIIGGGATLALNIGGAGEFTTADLDVLLSLGGASTGFMNNSTISLDTTNAVGAFTYGSVIANTNGGANALGLIKRGTGTLVLSGTNSYSGGTTVTGGLVSASADSNLGAVTGGLTINGGGLQVTGTTFTSLNSSRALTVSGAATFDIVDAANVFSSAASLAPGTGVLTKTGAGALTLSGGITTTSNIAVTGGVLTLQGVVSGSPTASLLTYGTVAGTAVVNVSNDMTLLATRGANIAGAVSVYNQTAGIVTVAPGTGNSQYVAGGAGYGYFNLTGGTYRGTGTSPRFDVTNGSSTGVAFVGGNSTLDYAGGEYFLIAYNGVGALGQLTVADSAVLNRNGATQPLVVFWSSSNSYGVLNVAGGNVDNTGKTVVFGSGNVSNQTGFVNLAAGTLTANGFTNSTGTGTSNFSYINFAGGTYQAAAAQTLVGADSSGNITRTTLFGPINNSAIGGPSFNGGAVIDTNGFAVTINRVLSGATGTAVTQSNISIPTTGNAGYVGAPAVQFSAPAGGGVPATGYALISNGQVSGIVITNPGTYASGETPTITLTGGGGAIAPFATTALNTANGAAGLTKTGEGTLTLTATNTYTGATIVNGGSLSILPTSLPGTSAVLVGSAGSGALDLYADGTGAAWNLGAGVNITLGSATTSGSLGFNLGTSSDSIFFNGGSLTINAGGGYIDGVAGAGFAIGNSYTVINNAASITGAANFRLGDLPAGYQYSITSTASSVTLNVLGLAPGGNLYWTGLVSDNWGGLSNWSALADGSTQAGYGPGASNIVYFSATNAGSAPINTVLGSPVSIQGLKVLNSGTGAISIAPGAAGTLTLGTAGIEIRSGAPASTTITAPIILGSPQTWSVASGTSLTASGIISGGAATGTTALTISGGGTVSLSGVNTFTGDVIVDGPGTTLAATVSQLNNADANSPLGAAGAHAYTLRNGATFTLIGANTLNPTAGSGKSFIIGTGGATLEVANSGGTISLDDAGQFALAAGATLTKTGPGVLVLGNNYDTSVGLSSSIVVSAGVLRLQNVNALGGSSKAAITLAGGSVDIRLNSGGTFGNNVTVTADTTISTGRSTASSANITQVLGALTIGSNTLTQSNGNGNTAPGVANLTFGATTLTGNPVFNVTNVNGAGLGTLTLGSINDAGSGHGITKTGAGILLLSGTSLYTGTTTITGGILQLARQVSLYGGNTSAWTASNILVGSGAALVLNVGGTGEFTSDNVAALLALGTGTGGFMNGSSAGLDTTNASGGSFTYDRNITNTNGGANVLGFAKAGAGTLVLSGANTYTGRTVIYGGALAGTIGGGSLVLNGGVFEASGTFTRSLGTGAGQVQWAAGGSGGFSAVGAPLTVTFAGSSNLIWDSTANFVTGAGQLLFGSTTSDNGVTFTHNLDLNDPGSAVTRTVQVLDNAAVTTDKTVFSGILSGGANATFAKTGAGVLELTGANTYAGPTTNTTGTLILSGSNSSAGTTTLTSGTLQLNNASNGGLASGLVTLTAGTLQALNADRILSNNVLLTLVTVAGTQSLTINGTVTGATGGSRTLTNSITSGTLTLGAVGINNDATAARTLTIAGTGNTLLGGVISNGNGDAFANALSITSAGATTLTAANTYTGATTINNTLGTVTLSGAGRLSTGALTVNAGLLNLSTALDQTVALLTMGGGTAGSSSSIAIPSGRTLTVSGVTYSATNNNLTAVISGAGTLNLGTAGITVNIGNSTAVDTDMSWEMNTVTGSGAFIKDGAGTLDIRGVTNFNYAATSYQINGGAVLGLGASSTNLILNGGVYEGSGTFTRSLGTGNNQVQWLALGGGFSARGGALTVTLAGAPSPLVWGSTPFFVPDAAPLIFGSTTADNVVTFTHDLNLNGQMRTVQVVDNTAVTTDRGALSGLISGTGASGITKTGNGTLRLTGANTFAGGVAVALGTLEFSTVSNNGGPASNLGQGTDAITLSGGTLSFVGDTTSQSTNRAITATASSTLSANGTNGAVITYAGAINVGTDFVLTLAGTGSGIISGGIIQPAGGSTADLTINSGNWTLTGASSSIADDVLLNGGTLTLVNTTVTLNDDMVVSGPAAVLNLNSTGVLAAVNPAGTSNGLYSRGGAVINLNANDVNGVANANGLDFIFLGEASTTGVGTLNTNTYNITIPRLDLGAIADGFTGVVLGTGTITNTYAVNDYAQGYRLFRGSIAASLAGVAPILKQGLGEVVLSGNNSGLTGTIAPTRLDSGSLVLDYSTDNNTKLNAAVALDLRGVTLILKGGVLGNTVQNVASTTLANGGSNVINVSSLGASSTTLNLGAITRANSAGTLVLVVGTSGVITTTTANNATTGVLGTTGTAFATINDGTGTYFAINNGSGTIVPLTYAAAKNDITTWQTGDHVTDSAGGYTGTVDRFSINSLRFNAAGSSKVNIGPLGTLTIGSGGILQTSNVTGGSTVIAGGRLVSGTNELVINTDSADSVFRISSYLSGVTAVAKAGVGTLLLDSVNHASGATNLQNGTLRITGGSAIGDRSTVTLADDHQVLLDMLDDETIGPLAGGSATTGLSTLAVVSIGSHTLTVNGHTNSSYSGLLTGTGRLVKTGTATLSLGGASTFTGDLIINQGQVTLATRTIANFTNVGSVTLNAGSLLLDFTGGTESSPNKINNNAPITLINTGGIDGLRANNDRTDANKAETLGVVTFLGGANTITSSESAATPGADRTTTITASSLVRSNRSTLLVRGQNLGTITAGVTGAFIASGRIVSTALPTLVGGAGAAGTTSISIVPWAIGATSITSTGTSFVTAVATTGFRPLDLTTEYEQLAASGGLTLTNNVRFSSAAGLTLDSAAARTMNALLVDNSSTTAAITLDGAGSSLNVASGAFLFTGSATPQGLTLSGFSGITTGSANEYVLHVVNTAAAGVTVSAPFTTAAAALTKSGAGTLILTATGSTYTGPTTVNQGVLQIDSLNKLGNLGSGGVFFNAGTLRFGAAFDLSAVPVVFGVAATGTVETTAGGTLDTNGFDITFGSSIGGGGNGGLTKIGTGTLTLNAPASYGGATAVTAGTLAYGVANALPTTTDLTLGAATLAIGANAATLRGLTLTAATASISGGSPLTFTGNAVNAGGTTLTINNSAATIFDGDYFFLAEAATARTLTLAVNGTGLVTITSAIVDGGAPASSLSKTGAGTLQLTGANSYSGTTTNTTGTLILSGSNDTTGATTLTSGTLQLDSASNGGLASGTLTLTAGTLQALNAARTISNSVVLNAVTVAGTQSLTLNGSLTNSGNNRTLTNSLTGGGLLTLAGPVYLSEATATGRTLTIAGTGDTLVSGVISNFNGAGTAGAFVSASSGLTTFSASNSYTGSTSINDGTLRLNAVQNMAGALQFGSAATTSTAGRLEVKQDATFTSMLVQTSSTTSTSSLDIDTGKTLTVTGNVVIGSGNAALSTTLFDAGGAGSWVVTNNTAGATFRVGGSASGGNVTMADLSDLHSLTVTLNTTDGVFRVNSTSGTNVSSTYSLLKLAQDTTITAAILAVGDGGQYNSIADQINQMQLGTGATVLNVNTINIGTGTRDLGSVTFQSPATGTLVVRAADGTGAAAFNLGTGTATTAATLPAGNRNTFDVTGHNADLLFGAFNIGTQAARTGPLENLFAFDQGTLATGNLTMGSKTAATNSTNILNLGGGTVTIGSGTGTAATLASNAGTGTVSSTINVTGGTVTIGSGSGQALVLASGNTNAAGSSVGVLNVSGGSVVLATTGTTAATLAAASAGSSTGSINITGGTLTAQGHILLGTGGGVRNASVTLNGGTLDMTGKNIGATGGVVALNAQAGTLKNVAEINGGAGLTKTTASTLVLEGTNTYTGGTTISAGVLQVGNGSTTGTLGSGTVTNNATLTFNRSNTYSVGDVITGSGTVIQAGSGTTVLSGANTYTGGTTVTAGRLSISSVSNLGSDPLTTAAAHLSLNGGTLFTSATLSMGVNRGVTVGAGGGAIETAPGTTATFNSVITGPGALAKEGSGTLIFTAVNTNTGPTSVNAGILGGTGTMGGNVIVNSTGTLAPGVGGAGVLTVTGNLVINSGGTLSNELGGATYNAASVVFNEMQAHGNLSAFVGNLPSTNWENYISGTTAHDHLQINGASASSVNGTVKISALLGGYNPVYGDIFDLMDWTFAGSLTGTPTYDFSAISLDPGLGFNTDLFLSNGIIVVVPEPSKALLLMLGLLGLLSRRRRR